MLTDAERCADKIGQGVPMSAEFGLLPSWELRRWPETLDVRIQRELDAVDSLLTDIDDLRSHRKFLDTHGLLENLRDVEAPDIRFNPVIESVEQDLRSSLERMNTSEAMQAARHEFDLHILRQALTLRRVLLIAYQLLRREESPPVNERPLDRDWVRRWRDLAQRYAHQELQELWARILIQETAQPGTHTLSDLNFYAELDLNSLDVLRFMARLVLDHGIWQEVGYYFLPEVHEDLFEQMQYWVLLGPVSEVSIKSVASSDFRKVLRCREKALYIEGPGLSLNLRQRLLSRRGQRLLSLLPVTADSAYLFALGQYLKQRGYR
ncbi:MAG: DUF2806 domain-containing protein, partial [Pseudomonadales bacterium]|nr:DUF2806 domain-containing protein [Pseudomonadales bacterium]